MPQRRRRGAPEVAVAVGQAQLVALVALAVVALAQLEIVMEQPVLQIQAVVAVDRVTWMGLVVMAEMAVLALLFCAY